MGVLSGFQCTFLVSSSFWDVFIESNFGTSSLCWYGTEITLLELLFNLVLKASMSITGLENPSFFVPVLMFVSFSWNFLLKHWKWHKSYQVSKKFRGKKKELDMLMNMCSNQNLTYIRKRFKKNFLLKKSWIIEEYFFLKFLHHGVESVSLFVFSAIPIIDIIRTPAIVTIHFIFPQMPMRWCLLSLLDNCFTISYLIHHSLDFIDLLDRSRCRFCNYSIVKLLFFNMSSWNWS